MTQYYEGVGRRKTSTARARLTSGETRRLAHQKATAPAAKTGMVTRRKSRNAR